MLEIIDKQIDDILKTHISLICSLTHVKPVFHNGSLKKINHSNLVYTQMKFILIIFIINLKL